METPTVLALQDQVNDLTLHVFDLSVRLCAMEETVRLMRRCVLQLEAKEAKEKHEAR